MLFLDDAIEGFFNWLKPLIASEKEAESISNRLREYFANSLFNQWKNNRNDYEIILTELDNPFGNANEKQQGWNRYRAWLQKQIQEPVFWEAFSLKQIYIPLRAYVEETLEENFTIEKQRNLNSSKRIVINPLKELETWLNKADKHNAIRLLTGSPGSGKSSFTKIFAAQLARDGKNVLFIPLHHFKLTGDMIKSIGEFLQFGDFLPYNPLERDNQDLQLIIVFDGLDELSQQGKIAQQVARDFIDEVRFLVKSFNQNQTRLQVLISGREIVIQANRNKFSQPQQLLYLLPYFITEKRTKKT